MPIWPLKRRATIMVLGVWRTRLRSALHCPMPISTGFGIPRLTVKPWLNPPKHRSLRSTYLGVLPFAFPPSLPPSAISGSGGEGVVGLLIHCRRMRRCGNAMLDEIQESIVRQIIQKAPNLTVQNPVHLLSRHPDAQRVQRLVLVARWPEAVRETPKILPHRSD